MRPSLSRRYRGRCDARFPPGKKSIAIRKLAPPNDAIYTRAPPPPSPSRIPRNSAAAGDWRWRPRALRDKRHQHTAPSTAQPTLLTNTSSSSSRCGKFRRWRGSYIKCIKYGSNPLRPRRGRAVEYLDTSMSVDNFVRVAAFSSR